MDTQRKGLKNFAFRTATNADAGTIRKLLRTADLPHEDVAAHLAHFLTAHVGDQLAGIVGLEIAGPFGLLRSLVVAEPFDGLGLGTRLCHQILEHARALGLRDVYLLTTTAPAFFKKLGFETVDRGDVPNQIRATAEFSSLCPASAVCMRLPAAP